MKSLTFVTGNANKADQLGRYLSFPVSHIKLDIPEIQSLDLEKVASEKAKSAYVMLGSPVLVEDTALTFESLNGLPGTLVKWFFESVGNKGLCKMLDGYQSRAAKAETCFALCDETGLHLFKSAYEGSVPDFPRGDMDFGWNPIFIPEGADLTWAEMDLEQSAATSMRRRAIEKLAIFLEEKYQ